MEATEIIRSALGMADYLGMAYLADMSDEELMRRPHPQCNHINWQVGHLISSEHNMVKGIASEVPDLPPGFADKYTKEKAVSDNPADFASKDELMQAYRAQRDATLAVLANTTSDQLGEPTGIDYAPTKGDLLRLQSDHWLMHCGQWVIVRRETGKPIVM